MDLPIQEAPPLVRIFKGPKTNTPVKKFHLTEKAGALILENGETLKIACTFNGTSSGPQIRVQEFDKKYIGESEVEL